MFLGVAEIDSITQEQIDARIEQIVKDRELWLVFKSFFDKGLTYSNLKSKYTRSILQMGAPLEVNGVRYQDRVDRAEDQGDFIEEYSKGIEDYYLDREGPGIRYLMFQELLIERRFVTLVSKDIMWAAGSVLFVFSYISWNLRSFFLGSVSMLIILMSFPITMTIYSYIFRITYLSTLH